MRMSCSDGTWHDFDYMDAMQSLPEVNNAMSFLTTNNFIAGPNNPPGTIAMCVSENITISVDGETIINSNTSREGNNSVLGSLPAVQENYNIFNCTIGEMNDFITLNCFWCLVFVIATNVDEIQEPHILLYHGRDQTGHYYLIEFTAQEVLMFRNPDLSHLANNLFTVQGRLNLVSKLRLCRPFANISPDYVNGEAPSYCVKNLFEVIM